MNPNRIFRDIENKVLSTGSKRTAKTYISALRLFCGYFYKAEHPTHINKKQIIEFLAWVRQFRGDSIARTCYWAVRYLYVEIEHQPNKFDGIKPIRVKAKPKIALKTQFILDRIKDVENPKDRAVLWLLFSSGMRREEIATLEQSNLDWENEIITVTGKGDKTRIVPFPKNVQEIVRKHLNSQKSSHYVFSGEKEGHWISPDTIYRIVVRYLDHSTHSTRRAYATALKNNGVDLFDIMKILGHKRITTTQIYLDTDEERIKSLYNPMKGVAA